MPLALLALALGAFAIGSTEFLTNGLLSSLSGEFDVTIAQAGMVSTAYALGQMCGPVLALALLRLPTKRTLLILMAIFTVGNFLASLSPSFGFLLGNRFVTAWSHTAFFGVASVAASGLVPAKKQGSAIALVFTGLTLSMLLGMPLGTLIGQAAGWRASFVVVTIISLISLVGLALLLPADRSLEPVSYRNSLRPFTNPRLWVALSATAIGFGGLFASFTFIEPMLTQVSGFSSGQVIWLLGIYGAGLVVGNSLSGKAADRALVRTTVVLLLLLATVLAVLALAPPIKRWSFRHYSCLVRAGLDCSLRCKLLCCVLQDQTPLWSERPTPQHWAQGSCSDHCSADSYWIPPAASRQ